MNRRQNRSDHHDPPALTHGSPTHRPGAHRRGRAILFALVFVGFAVATLAVVWVLVTMFQHKQAAREPFVRVADVSEITTDPEPWGRNWPHQFDGWKSTASDEYYGGSSAMPASKLEKHPWLKRLYSGYAFSLDYREIRGHAYMLFDQRVTERVTKREQSGACLHCHSSNTVLYRKVGREALGLPTDDASLAESLDMPAMVRGFEELSREPYGEVLSLLYDMPDGTPGENEPAVPQPQAVAEDVEFDRPGGPEAHEFMGEAHPVSCVDCHDPETMGVRVTRPGFVLGIADLAEGDAPVPHLPSIDAWRRGDRDEPYDPNTLASR